VTSLNSGEAKNFGRAEHMEHDARYDRADEFMDVVLGHWNTWEDDVLIPRQGEQPLCRFGKGAPAGSRGTLFSIARPIQRAALAARASRAHPGASVRPRPVFCREVADLVFVIFHGLQDGIREYVTFKAAVAVAAANRQRASSAGLLRVCRRNRGGGDGQALDH